MAQRVDFELRGIKEVLRGLKGLQPPEVTKVIEKGAKVTAQKVLVPAIKSEARNSLKNPGSHRGHPGKRGARGPLARNVTVRKVKLRRGEWVALSTAPRAWYRHFVTGGTNPHSLAPRRLKLTAAERARWPIHPGSTPNPFVERAARRPGVSEEFTKRHADDIIAHYKKVAKAK